MKTLVLALLALSPFAAQAAQVAECGSNLNRIDNIAEPWEANSKTFYNGKVRIAYIDTIEPACCSAHLVIITPDDEMGSNCYALSAAAASDDGVAQGFQGLDFKKIKGKYVDGKGLTLEVPYALYDPENTGDKKPKMQIAKILVNLKNEKQVTLEK